MSHVCWWFDYRWTYLTHFEQIYVFLISCRAIDRPSRELIPTLLTTPTSTIPPRTEWMWYRRCRLTGRIVFRGSSYQKEHRFPSWLLKVFNHLLICAEGRQQRIFTHRWLPPCTDKGGGGFVTPEIITIITYANLWSTDDHVLGCSCSRRARSSENNLRTRGIIIIIIYDWSALLITSENNSWGGGMNCASS